MADLGIDLNEDVILDRWEALAIDSSCIVTGQLLGEGAFGQVFMGRFVFLVDFIMVVALVAVNLKGESLIRIAEIRIKLSFSIAAIQPGFDHLWCNCSQVD